MRYHLTVHLNGWIYIWISFVINGNSQFKCPKWQKGCAEQSKFCQLSFIHSHELQWIDFKRVYLYIIFTLFFGYAQTIICRIEPITDWNQDNFYDRSVSIRFSIFFFINKWTIFKLFTQYNRTGLKKHTHTLRHIHTTKLILCAAHDVNWNDYVLDNLCIQIKIKYTIIALHSKDSFVSAEIMIQNNCNERMIHLRMQFSKEILCFPNPFFVFLKPFWFHFELIKRKIYHFFLIF